jgi:hypothetical protein
MDSTLGDCGVREAQTRPSDGALQARDALVQRCLHLRAGVLHLYFERLELALKPPYSPLLC